MRGWMSCTTAAADDATAFVDVHVLSPQGDQMLVTHTVLVEDGRIRAVGPSAEARVPETAAPS